MYIAKLFVLVRAFFLVGLTMNWFLGFNTWTESLFYLAGGYSKDALWRIRKIFNVVIAHLFCDLRPCICLCQTKCLSADMQLLVIKILWSTPQRPWLHLDVSGQQEAVLHLDVLTLQGPELHRDESGQQEPVLLLDVSTQQGAWAAPRRI